MYKIWTAESCMGHWILAAEPARLKRHLNQLCRHTSASGLHFFEDADPGSAVPNRGGAPMKDWGSGLTEERTDDRHSKAIYSPLHY
jgi:hypothetical protein